SLRDATQYVGNVTYTISPTTVVSVRGDYHSFIDASNFVIPSGSPTFSTFWPNQSFYGPIYASGALPKLVPRMTILDPSGLNQNVVMGASGGYWQQKPNQDAIAGQISHQYLKHFLKGGFEF